uniref:Peptidase S74 domain-containing protein n=1 Tax=uncultured marine virus TaxID=186617 RepID=A0A0F7LBT2_9VIRU|nr:hypothetical protein SWVG_00011 [uncultured marine virus]
MSIIYSYPIKGAAVDDDLILISDSASTPKFATKQVRVSGLPFSNNQGTVTSVGVSMPSAFAVAGSPITSSGNIAVTTTGGNVGQFLAHDGTWGTPAGGAANPAGAVSQIQYHDTGGVFGASPDFSYASSILRVKHTINVLGQGNSLPAGRIKLHCENSSHGVTLEGPAHAGNNSYLLKFPSAAPTNNQILEYTTAGSLGWIATPSGAGGSYTAGDGLQLNGTVFSTDLKENGGLVIESNELALDLSASSITGTLATSDGGTGSSSTEYCNLEANVTGTLPVGKGGTGVATLGANRLILGNGPNAVTSISSQTKGTLVVGNNTTTTTLAVGATNGHVLTIDSSEATGVRWTAATVAASNVSGSIDLTTQVTGTLPVGNGGIGQASLTSNGIARGQGTSGIISDSYLEFDGTNKRLNIRGSGNTDPSSLGATLNIIDASGPQQGAENCIALAPAGGQGARGINIDLGSYNEGIKIVRTNITANTAMNFMQSVSGTTQIGSISMTNGATAYNTTSDYRLKENVVEMTGSVDRVKQLKPSRFNFISEPDTKIVDGFLAHEVSSVVPEAIHGEKDAVDDQGNIIYQGIDQSKLVPLLVGAIKELTARIEALEA